MRLGETLRRARRQCPAKAALHFEGGSWSYGELDDRSDRVAAALHAAGVRAGQRVAMFLPNCPELVLGYFACFKLGAVSVPLNYRYRREEAHHAIRHSGATTLVAHAALAAEVDPTPGAGLGLERCYLVGRGRPPAPFRAFDDLLTTPAVPLPAPAFDEGQPAAILYTSGTTARPKGVVYTHATLGANNAMQVGAYALTPDDVHLISCPACHAAGLTGQLLPGLQLGCTLVLLHLPSPAAVVAAIRRHGVTRVKMLPAALGDLVEYLEQHPETRLPSWRCCTAGGDLVPPELHERFRRVAGFSITELVAMTEACPYLSNRPFGQERCGSAGTPLPGVRVRLVDGCGLDVIPGEVGQILVQSPAMMVGYWGDPEASARALADGWLHTGDLARQDRDGTYWFAGRLKEVIIRGGSNISPLEVEAVLDRHPAVHLSCVVGVPDRHLGAVVVAYVLLGEDCFPRPSEAELRWFVGQLLATYKVPDRILVVPHLPLNPAGKVDRKRLHTQVLADLASAPAPDAPPADRQTALPNGPSRATAASPA